MGLLIGRDGQPGLVSVVRLDKGSRVKKHSKGISVPAVNTVPMQSLAHRGKSITSCGMMARVCPCDTVELGGEELQSLQVFELR